MTQTAELAASGGEEYDEFGGYVAIDGTTVVVAADDANVGTNLGAIYVYNEPATGWTNMVEPGTIATYDAAGDGDEDFGARLGSATARLWAGRTTATAPNTTRGRSSCSRRRCPLVPPTVAVISPNVRSHGGRHLGHDHRHKPDGRHGGRFRHHRGAVVQPGLRCGRSDHHHQPAQPGRRGRTVDVTVTTAGGTSPVTPGDQFTYVAPAIPAITTISPTSGPTTGGTAVTITGVNLLAPTSPSAAYRRPSSATRPIRS